MSTHVSPAAFIILDNKPAGPAAFPFFILMIDVLTIHCLLSKVNYQLDLLEIKYSYPMQNLCSKAYDNFSNLFSYLRH